MLTVRRPNARNEISFLCVNRQLKSATRDPSSANQAVVKRLRYMAQSAIVISHQKFGLTLLAQDRLRGD